MKNSLVIKPFSTLLFLTLVLCFSSTASAARVVSMANIGEQLNAAGETITVIDVKCAISTASPRLIVSKVGDSQWCSKDLPDLCSRNKVGAATKVCKSGFNRQVEESRTSSNQLDTVDTSPPQVVLSEPVNSSLSAEGSTIVESSAELDKLALEKQRISIEKERLQLRRQELELNKRRLEIERQATGIE